MTQQQPVLTDEEQYRNELANFPRLTAGEKRELETLARGGDEHAKQRIIIDCMHYVWNVAWMLIVYLHIDELMDLVQVGNLAILEHFDAALSKREPAVYLYGIAKRLMRNYTFYNSRLIRIPEHPELLANAPSTVSLEGSLLSELIADVTPEEQGAFDAIYGSLSEAVGELTPKQQESIKAMHRMEGYDPELRDDPYTLRGNYKGAIARLRKILKQA